MVIDANTGQVLHQQSPDDTRYPASLTKMMTLYLAFELLEQGRLNPASRIKISPEAAATAPSKLGLAAGSDIALGDALRIISVKSANDISVALAEHIAGSEDKFAALMTRKARQLGMANTTFRNAHGLPNSGQVTTARDMLTLALRLNDDFPKYYGIFSLKSFSYGGTTFRNHNTMLTTYPGMDGLKTGYTTPSGFNLVASVRRNGRHVVAAVFGGSTASARNAHMRTILDRALLKASPDRTRLSVPIARVSRPERQAVATPTLNEPPRRAERPRPAAIAPSSLPLPLAKAAATPAAPPPPRIAEAAASPVPSRPIAVAKVRPIVIAPRPRPEPSEAVDPPHNSTPVVATAPLAEPTAASQAPLIPDRVAVFDPPAQPIAPPPASQRLSAFSPSTQAPAGAMRGAAPSSLQAQAQRLERGEDAVRIAPAPTPVTAPVTTTVAGPLPPPQRVASATISSTKSTPQSPPFHLKGPEVAQPRTPASPAQDRVVIQIGAYATPAEAERYLTLARSKVGAVLATAVPATEPVQSGGRQLHRARFTGLDPTTAAKACIELRRAQIDCLVAKPQ